MLQNRINYLSNLGVETLLLECVLEANGGPPKDTTNFTGVFLTLKDVEEFKKSIIDYASKKGILLDTVIEDLKYFVRNELFFVSDVHLIISFIPNFSGGTQEFIRFLKGEDDYEDLYLWYPQKYNVKPENPPNNWVRT